MIEESFSRSGGDVFLEIKKPGDDALNVGVQNRHRLVECEGHNSRSRVGSDAGKSAQEVEVARNTASKLRDNGLRRAMQVACAGVVAKALPVLHDIHFRRSCEGCDIGKPLHPSLKIRLHGGDRRLLEHELRNQNGIWRWIRPPRQDTAVDAEPFLERLVEIGSSIF